MFYLETKDGEKFFTDPKSDDSQEFEKIISAKLGESAAELYRSLLDDTKETNEELLSITAGSLENCIEDLEKILNAKELNRISLEDILAELQRIYNQL